VLTLVLSAGCSAHSLDYLQQGKNSVSTSGHAGVLEAGSPPVAAGAPPAGTSSGGAAGDDGPAARCDDLLVNGDESDADCGGRVCSPCDAGKHCLLGNDCASAICTNQVCQAPSCTDLARNGDETDVNCGGSCPPCSIGHGCQVGADCETANCASAVCSMPNCDGPIPGAGCPLLIDNTPYSFRPASAPASCIDGVSRGVDDGVEMQQYKCSDGVNQTFWALAAPKGYFALRNALSGKCLQVRANSLASDAVIEQATCTGQAEQLFLPSADSGGVKIVVQSSGLSLDVAGSQITSNGQRIVQSADDGSLDMRWSIVRAGTGAFLTLSAVGQTGSVLRHVGTEIRAESSTSGDSQWKVEPGLAEPGCVSFESSDQPGAYLRHANYLLWSDISDGSLLFSRDATFCFRAPLSGTDGAFRSLESINYPGDWINASDGRVRLLAFQDTAQFRQLSTWLVGQRK
jgi:hypothetical protein